MKFNINNYKGMYAMHCKTEQEAESFCHYLKSIGKTWFEGDDYSNTYWSDYREDTVYYFNEDTSGGIGDLGLNENDEWVEYITLEWSDFEDYKEFKYKMTVSEFLTKEYNNIYKTNSNIFEILEAYCSDCLYCPLKEKCSSDENKNEDCLVILEKYLQP